MDDLQRQEDILTAALYSALGKGAHNITCSVYYGTYQMRVRVAYEDSVRKRRGLSIVNSTIRINRDTHHLSRGKEHAVACLVNALSQSIPEGHAVNVKVHGKRYDIVHEDGINVYESTFWSRLRGWFDL